MASGISLSATEKETELTMSATTALVGPVHYKEELKLMRAKTAADWTIGAFAQVIDALRAEPARTEWLDELSPPRKRYYGAFY